MFIVDLHRINFEEDHFDCFNASDKCLKVKIKWKMRGMGWSIATFILNGGNNCFGGL